MKKRKLKQPGQARDSHRSNSAIEYVAPITNENCCYHFIIFLITHGKS